jgi:hypothetical protein
MTRSAVNLDDLTPEEQLDLLEEIWDRLSSIQRAFPCPMLKSRNWIGV